MSTIRTLLLTIGLVTFLLGLYTGYGALQEGTGNIGPAFALTGGGAVLTLLALWWPRSR